VRGRIPPALVVALLAGWLLTGCRREERNYRPAPPFAGAVRYAEDYEQNAYALTEGKRLFSAFNCTGCHGHGGGGMGPPLMDDKWLYGAEPEQVFDTISKGRPNGMPAFGGAAREPGITVVGTVPEYQRWQLVAYVRSMSGLASPNAAPGRDDHMSTRPPENSTDPRPPRVVPPPPDVEPPK
jgi:cytochrome c oxidase cbb3-type subunit III